MDNGKWRIENYRNLEIKGDFGESNRITNLTDLPNLTD